MRSALLVAPLRRCRAPRRDLWALGTQKLNVEVNAAVQTEEITKQFVTVGLVPIGKGSLDELDAFVKSETARWAKVIRNAGLAGTQ